MKTDRPARIGSREVVEQLKDWIKHGLLVPGQRLVEADVVRDSGASRAHVREAFQRLESEGVVVIEEFRGASVRRLSRSEVEQMYRAREALEGMAARLIAERGLSLDKQQELRRLQSALNEAALARRADEYSRNNELLHRFISDNADNANIAVFLERLRLPLVRLQFRFLMRPEEMEKSNRDHFALVTHILERNPEGAEQAMRKHIRDALENLQRLEDSSFA